MSETDCQPNYTFERSRIYRRSWFVHYRYDCQIHTPDNICSISKVNDISLCVEDSSKTNRSNNMAKIQKYRLSRQALDRFSTVQQIDALGNCRSNTFILSNLSPSDNSILEAAYFKQFQPDRVNISLRRCAPLRSRNNIIAEEIVATQKHLPLIFARKFFYAKSNIY